jgi:hypothetical protein
MGENLCKLLIRLIARIYRELKKLNSPKINDPIKKWASELNRTFSKEEVQMIKKHMKKCPPSLAIKEMQIETTLKFHLSPVAIAIIKNTTITCCGDAGKKNPHTLLVIYVSTTTTKTIWRLLKKLNIDLPHDPAIPLLQIYTKECESGYYKGTCTPMFITALFTIAKLWKQPRCKDAPIPTNGLRKCGIYTQWNFIQPQRMKFCHS